MKSKKPDGGGGHQNLHPGSRPSLLLFCVPGPLGRPVALVVQLQGQAKARTTRPSESPAHAQHTGGEEPGPLSHRPPREDLPHPGRPPHSRGGFWPGKAVGQKGPGRPPTWREGPARLPRLPAAAAAAGRRGACRPGRLLGHRFSTYPRG